MPLPDPRIFRIKLEEQAIKNAGRGKSREVVKVHPFPLPKTILTLNTETKPEPKQKLRCVIM